MNHVTHTTIVNFIWGIDDDVLRDVYAHGKYRDVILPMTVIIEAPKTVVEESPEIADKLDILDDLVDAMEEGEA